MVCKCSRSEVVDFVCPYRVGIECEKECKIILNGEEMEEVNEFKYPGSVVCKHDGTEGETRERALQGSKVVGKMMTEEDDDRREDGMRDDKEEFCHHCSSLSTWIDAVE